MIPIIGKATILEPETGLDRAVAEEFFGWRWMAFFGHPTKSTPGYPAEMRVRQFMSPKQLKDKQWKDFFAKNEGAPATGNEPLSYAYWSGRGVELVPRFTRSLDAAAQVEAKIRKSKRRWDRFRKQLWVQVVGRSLLESEIQIDERRLSAATPEQRCIAALAVVDSQFLHPKEPTHD